MEFRRINTKSHLFILTNPNLTSPLNLQNCFDEAENNQNIILQVVRTEIFTIVEYIERDITVRTEPQQDLDFENYLDTIINNDPFGAKYSGKPLKAIFEAGDKEWLDNALKNMRNEFIRERLKYIVEHGGYGKITN